VVWVKLDDGFFGHPKARSAGKDGRALFLAGLCYAGANLTDGKLSTSDLPIIAAMAEVPKNRARILVECGLWDEVADGWQIHEFLERNPSRETVESEREAARERMRKVRSSRSSPEQSPKSQGNFERSSPNPVPSRPEENNSSLPTDSVEAHPQAVDDDPLEGAGQRARAAIDALADSRLATANGVENPRAYRAAIRGELEATLGETAFDLAQADPDATPLMLAAKLRDHARAIPGRPATTIPAPAIGGRFTGETELPPKCDQCHELRFDCRCDASAPPTRTTKATT
jgi:hypothetical protein